MAQDAWLESGFKEGAFVLRAGGAWRVQSAADLDRKLEALDPGAARSARIDLTEVDSLDSAGAWLLLRTEHAFQTRGISVTVENVRPEIEPLLRKVETSGQSVPRERRRVRHHGARDFVRGIGEATIWFLLQGAELVGFLGLVAVTILRTLRKPSRLRLISLVTHMERTGVTAMPIVGMICFLIGVVLVYQGADQLHQFGAEIFTVNLLGIGILRELGILLTAIIVAGRSGSAFTAEIGAMKVHEEVDAMRTLGLDPSAAARLARERAEATLSGFDLDAAIATGRTVIDARAADKARADACAGMRGAARGLVEPAQPAHPHGTDSSLNDSSAEGEQ